VSKTIDFESNHSNSCREPNLDRLSDDIYQLSVVIPVYRSQESLQELYQRVVATLTGLGISFEILFVEDCGGDNSWKIISQLAQQDDRVRGLKMSRNYGQHNALLAGIRAASGELIVTLDDDLQHPPEELPKLLAKIEDGYDVAYGVPDQEQHGFFRNMASQITKIALQRAMGADIARNVSAFRVFRSQLRQAFHQYRSPSVNIDILLTWATTRFTSLPVRHDARKHGESGYTTRSLTVHAINMMTGFSTAPLKLASVTGFLFALFGVFVLVYVLLRYFLEGVAVPGFAFLASIIALFSGAQLLAIGIMGEYLARMHQRTMERPAYLLSETTRQVN
jgi:undecaprenyl-phosphate 4-deoxy-4-formamido-L-arabinose transferase